MLKLIIINSIIGFTLLLIASINNLIYWFGIIYNPVFVWLPFMIGAIFFIIAGIVAMVYVNSVNVKD